MVHLAAFGVGFAADMLLGDPLGGFHIVVFMGKLIGWLEKLLRRIFPKTEKGEFWGGVVLTILMCAGCYFFVLGLLLLCAKLHWTAVLVVESFLCWQCLAMRSLAVESKAVYKCAADGNLSAARKAVGRIVGRDTASLDMAGVLRACVETVAENCADGVIAPMLYMAIGGAPLGVLYKAINTMDSMVGYKNERYYWFGKAAARLDDAANFVPARLAAVLLVISAALCGQDAAGAWKIFRRDRFCHTSPNSAQTESVCAGALHLRLGGSSVYFGKPVEKPTIGDDLRPISPDHILQANQLMVWGSVLLFAVSFLVKGGLLLC